MSKEDDLFDEDSPKQCFDILDRLYKNDKTIFTMMSQLVHGLGAKGAFVFMKDKFKGQFGDKQEFIEKIAKNAMIHMEEIQKQSQ